MSGSKAKFTKGMKSEQTWKDGWDSLDRDRRRERRTSLAFQRTRRPVKVHVQLYFLQKMIPLP